MDKFYEYLIRERNQLYNIVLIAGNADYNGVLASNLKLLDDIIHHFEEFVKDAKDTDRTE